MSKLDEKLIGIMKRKDKTKKRGPSSLRNTITAEDLEKAEIDKLSKAFSETLSEKKTSDSSMDTAQGRKKTRKKKGKKRKTRKCRKNHAVRSHDGRPVNKVA